jgi:hypothetical protein
MRKRCTLFGAAAFVSAIATLAFAVSPVGASRAAGGRSIAASGITSPQGGALGTDTGLQNPEFAGESEGDEGPAQFGGIIVNRSFSKHSKNGVSVNSGTKAKSNPSQSLTFAGLNHRNQRLANGGNQFSLEPPDQGLCVGNGFVLETVNDVLRIYDTSGNALTGVIDQNTFYGYPPAINRTTGVRGPFTTDPSCLFDQQTQRWFHVVLTLDVNPGTGAFPGSNHLDIAVSQTADPTGVWTIYRLPVQDDGTDGTPDHGCALNDDGTGHGPCLGDYPHIGADANGFYITTNEYAFAPSFVYMGAQIYAFPKATLAASASTVPVVQFDTSQLGVGGKPGFTIWPAQSPSDQFATSNGGTEYFMSSDAGDEAQCDSGTPCSAGTGTSNRLLVWSLTNTSSLNTPSPLPTLSKKVLTVGQYGIPPKSNQKPGDNPLGQCINDTTLPTPFGPGCWQFLFVAEPAHNEVISHLDSNDTRMQQTWFANGKLWGALDTALTLNSVNKAAIEYFIVNPSLGKLVLQGYLGLAGNNLTYPAIATTSSGRGVVAFTVVGDDHYPSAGYAGIDAKVGVGDIHFASEGLGVADGFTSYKAFVGNPPRTRWGDYGAAALDGSSIWVASESIEQTCTFAQYTTGAFGSCGGTRTSLGNWGTRITKITP